MVITDAMCVQVPEQAKHMATYFAMFYASINIGSMISTIATPYLRSATVLSQSADAKFYCTFYLLPVNNVRCISMLRCNHQTLIVVDMCMCNIHLLSLGIYDKFKSQIDMFEDYLWRP